MSAEIPNQEILIQQICLLNSQLDRVTQAAVDQKIEPFQDGGTELIEEIAPGSTFPSFWNHYVCGSGIGQASSYTSEAEYKKEPIDPSIIRIAQARAIRYIGQWLEDQTRSKTVQETATCRSARAAYQAFDWTKNPLLFKQLVDPSVELGNTYSMLVSGKKLIGFE